MSSDYTEAVHDTRAAVKQLVAVPAERRTDQQVAELIEAADRLTGLALVKANRPEKEPKITIELSLSQLLSLTVYDGSDDTVGSGRAPIVPEDVTLHPPGYTPGHWDYPSRCANIELALDATRERIEEWDRDGDPHGWWHERPDLIALYNEVVRLRAEAAATLNLLERAADLADPEA